MNSDVSHSGSAQNCIANSVQKDVRIRMTGKPLVMVNLEAAEPQFLAGDEAVRIKSNR